FFRHCREFPHRCPARRYGKRFIHRIQRRRQIAGRDSYDDESLLAVVTKDHSRHGLAGVGLHGTTTHAPQPIRELRAGFVESGPRKTNRSAADGNPSPSAIWPCDLSTRPRVPSETRFRIVQSMASKAARIYARATPGPVPDGPELFLSR